MISLFSLALGSIQHTDKDESNGNTQSPVDRGFSPTYKATTVSRVSQSHTHATHRHKLRAHSIGPVLRKSIDSFKKHPQVHSIHEAEVIKTTTTSHLASRSDMDFESESFVMSGATDEKPIHSVVLSTMHYSATTSFLLYLSRPMPKEAVEAYCHMLNTNSDSHDLKRRYLYIPFGGSLNTFVNDLSSYIHSPVFNALSDIDIRTLDKIFVFVPFKAIGVSLVIIFPLRGRVVIHEFGVQFVSALSSGSSDPGVPLALTMQDTYADLRQLLQAWLKCEDILLQYLDNNYTAGSQGWYNARLNLNERVETLNARQISMSTYQSPWSFFVDVDLPQIRNLSDMTLMAVLYAEYYDDDIKSSDIRLPDCEEYRSHVIQALNRGAIIPHGNMHR